MTGGTPLPRAQPLQGQLRAAADIHGETGLDGPAFGEPAVSAEPPPSQRRSFMPWCDATNPSRS